ncbi:F0F1 ATP synthase subunit delta [Lichenibacterium dinghuense]|uniref:F0F1 ATP synthase subunit delta n=1 Tax=Lichenibacterium dinghuense TaxID=2895977 RepID=UPI001F0006FE|nr:F0F1 ATP synthase subunit delta [Lichenibacterium sp. 6Y81]
MADAENIVSGMAGRYASALFSLAKDSRSIDKVAADLRAFDALIADNADLQLLVRSPAFSAEDQTRALKAVLGRAGVSGLTANFLLLVASKRRLFAVRTMIRDYLALDDADRGVSRAQVTVAEPLSGDQLAALKASLAEATGGKSVEVDMKVDPEIIGGIVVRLGSRMVDASIRTKLNSIRTRMKEVG